MLFEKLVQARSKHNVLSQCDTLGSFDFFSSIVSLDSLNEKNFENLGSVQKHLRESLKSNGNLTLDSCNILRRFLPLAQHEYTHFIDSTSTVWGIKYLNLMAKAYESDNRRFNVKEDVFFQAKQFSDFLRFIKLPSYFTDKSTITNVSRPWTYRESIGNRFNSFGKVSLHPVLFTQFGNNKGEQIVRSPVSTLSILECSAMSQEVACNIDLIMGLEQGVRGVDIRLYTQELLDYIYNKDLTEYSVCAHLLANFQKNSDIALTFRSCGIICRYVLNTPSVVYKNLAENADLLSVFGSGCEEWVSKIKQGLELCEPGFLYYLICKLLPTNSLESITSLTRGLNEAYKLLGIEVNNLRTEAKSEFKILLAQINKSQLRNIIKISNSGYKNFEMINWDKASLPFDTLDLPPALLGDSSPIQIFPGVEKGLRTLDLEQLFEDMIEGQSWVERFSEACA
jgi:hypothetical protein